jgi:hypothetical protein
VVSYFVDVDANTGNVLGLFSGSPLDAINPIAISDAEGEQLRATSDWSLVKYVNGAIVVDVLMPAQNAKRAEIEQARDASCHANVTAHGRQWQADERSQKLLGNAIALSVAGLPLPAVWRDANNENMSIGSLADLLAIAGAIAQQTQNAYANSWARKLEIAAATTIAEVEAVVW